MSKTVLVAQSPPSSLCLRGPSHPSETMARAPAIEPKLQHQGGRRVEGKGHMALITRNNSASRLLLTHRLSLRNQKEHTITFLRSPRANSENLDLRYMCACTHVTRQQKKGRRNRRGQRGHKFDKFLSALHISWRRGGVSTARSDGP